MFSFYFSKSFTDVVSSFDDVRNLINNLINSLLSVCHQQNVTKCVFAKRKNIKVGVMQFIGDVISPDILLSAPNTPLHKRDNTQDYATSNGGKKIESTGTSFRAQAFPSGISPSYDL